MKKETEMGWFGFWLFMSAVYYCAHLQYMAGYDNSFFGWKTEEEKALREAVITKAVKP